MIRLYVPDELEEGCCVSLSEKQHHYVLHVMRLHVGADVLLFNGRDGLWRSEIDVLDKKKAILTARARVQAQTPLDGADLYMAVVKKEAMDLVVQKAVELGARSVHPVVCTRSVLSKINQPRLQQIAVEAAEQCERLCVPVVHAAVSLGEALKSVPTDKRIVFLSERGESSGVLERGQQMAFFIGPEGGFTPAEIELMAAQAGAVSLHLGSTILRAETAAMAALACYAFDIF